MNRWLIVSLVLTVLSLSGPLVLYFGWPDLLKDPIPTHTNAAGEVDGWTPRARILPQWLILPILMAGLLGLAVLMPWMSPKGFEVDRFRETFFFLMAVITLLFGYIHLLFVLGAVQGVQIDMSRWLLGGLSLFFALLGNRLGKVQRNFWMGVRTPWTLASETVWIQTHRLTAWLWTAGGILLAVIGFAGFSA
ncbi:MAG: SdpI family protein, partial [Gemmataceae bacterium]